MNCAQNVLHEAKAEEGAGHQGGRGELSRHRDRIVPGRGQRSANSENFWGCKPRWTVPVLGVKLDPAALHICHLC